MSEMCILSFIKDYLV